MAVYIELVVSDISRTFNNYVDKKKRKRRGGAGESNVRRPLRGLEIKDDTYATLRVVKTDGTEIPLFDSSDAAGESTNYANFIIQSVQDARMEKQQIIETFGEPYIFFFGEAPRFIDVQAVLINSLDFNWRAEWWKNYDEYLRGTRLVEMGAKAYLFYDEIIVEGFIVQASAQEDSMNPLMVNLNFRMFVTNYANISFIGDPYYPIRESANVPSDIDLYDISAIDKLAPKKTGFTPKPGVLTQEMFMDYFKKLRTQILKNAIAKARTIDQAIAYQREYQLKALGASNSVTLDGTQLLSDAFQKTKKKYGELLSASKEKGANASAKLLQQAVTDTFKDAAEKAAEDVANTLKNVAKDVKKQFTDNFKIHTGPDGFGSTFDVAAFLRQRLRMASPYPGTNIDQFVRDATATLERSNTPPPVISRNFPYRSVIADNFDEYTGGDIYGRDAAALNRARISVEEPVNAPSEDPPKQTNDELCKRGAQVGPKEFFAFGMANWSPGQGWQTSSGSGSGALPPGMNSAGGQYGGAFGGPGIQRKGITFAFGTGQRQPNYPGASTGYGFGYSPAFSRTPGATIGIGGAYGGSMGGAIGANVGGAWGGYGSKNVGDPNYVQSGNPLLQQLHQNSFGLATGDAYGNTSPGTAAYKYTAGYGPDGWYANGGPVSSENAMTPSQNAFGGGATLTAAASLNLSIGGTGAFGIQSAPGSLDPTLQGGGKKC